MKASNVHFKCNIEMDLDFYLRASTCKKTRNWKTALVQKGLFLENPKSNFQNT